MTWLRSAVRRIFSTTIPLILLCIPCQTIWAIDDPGVIGPLSVSGREYRYADILLPGFPGPVEVRAIVWHPTTMGPYTYPLIIFLHGRHATCYQGTRRALGYPCPSGYQDIPSYRGFDYLAASLASNGYIVVSISANGINAQDGFDPGIGASARAQLIQYHLNIWRTFNSGAAPFGGIFRGRVNLSRVGTMGHSRGGEAVVRHFLYNASLGLPTG